MSMHPLPPGTRPHLVAVAVLGVLAACGSAKGADPAAPPPGVVKVPASAFPLDGPTRRGEDPDGPVTHLGRSVLPRCHKMTVAHVVGVSDAGRGAEIVRIEDDEILWGPPESDEGPYAVLCGSMGLAPRPPGRALFLLRLLPHGDYEALDVAPLDDADGPARLRAFRKVLEIEALPDPAVRRDALLVSLRTGVASEDRWTRANAIREYAAFAEAFPGALRTEDAAALSRVLPRVRDAELKRLAQTALDRVPSVARTPVAPPAADPGAAAAAALAPFERRFEAAGADASERRKAVLECAARLDRGAEPLVARGLADADPAVREASAAAAGEVGVVSLVPRLVSAAATDASPAVRTTCVVALGHMRASGAVDTLAGLARSDPDLGREALFALARIRDDAAQARLRDLRASGDEERRRLVDFLLSEDFVRQERSMGAKWATGL